MVNTFSRQVTKGVRWIEANGGATDYAWHEGKLVSVDGGYLWVGEPRNPRGIRWVVETGPHCYVSDEAKALLADDGHMEWLRG
tara:strand:+ start:2887 stop:3135 length:249 start_codon:yes stop_codon:yes gene_type:complete